MAKQKINVQWERVFGPDLDPLNAINREINAGIMKSKDFIQSCKMLNIDPTKRQASKWGNKKGSAYKFFHETKEIPF